MTSSGGMVVSSPPAPAPGYHVCCPAISEAKSIVRTKGGEGKCLLAQANLQLFFCLKVQTGKEGNY